jgi:hypothetical protein
MDSLQYHQGVKQMSARVFTRPNGWLVLWLIILSLPGCGGANSQYVTRPVQGSQSLSVEEITQMAGQSLQMMGYGIQEQNIPAGYIYARKRVAEDIYGRSTEMKISVQPDEAGEKVLGVEAFSCPGCIPEAHFSPFWMANQFYTFFDLVYKASGRFVARQSVSPSPVQAPAFVPGPPSPPEKPGRAPSSPSLEIIKVEIDPPSVQAGSRFHILTEYRVQDPGTAEKEVPVYFRFSILRGSQVLYNPEGMEIKSLNGGIMKRTDPMNASVQKGGYAAKVTIQFKSASAEGTANFKIQ